MPTNYESQRVKKTPPHVSIGDVRGISGKTLDQVCEAVSEVTGQPFTRGALSAIENGHRGASAQTLAALEVAYGLRPGAIKTDYVPRSQEVREAGSINLLAAIATTLFGLLIALAALWAVTTIRGYAEDLSGITSFLGTVATFAIDTNGCTR